MKGFIKNIEIDFISLVKKGANQKEIIYKAGNAFTLTVDIKKTDEERKMVYGVVYSPDEIDLQGQHTNAEEIEKAAALFMKNGKTKMVDKNHDENPVQGFIKESWIKKEVDPLFPEEKNGAWIVGIKIENEETWAEIKKGEITGLSMQGVAVVEQETAGTRKGENTAGGLFHTGKGLVRIIKEYINSAIKGLSVTENGIRKSASELIEHCISAFYDSRLTDEELTAIILEESVNFSLKAEEEGISFEKGNPNGIIKENQVLIDDAGFFSVQSSELPGTELNKENNEQICSRQIAEPEKNIKKISWRWL